MRLTARSGTHFQSWEASLDRVRGVALRALVPPPRLVLSEWIERNLVIPGDVSSLPGAVRLWPFQRGIADAIGDPMIERVTVVKSARVGYTTLLTGAIGAYVANDPSPVLAVLPTESDCRDYMVSDLEPIFAASPTLADALSDERDEAGRNTLLSKRFPGGSLKLVAAKSPRNLRRHNARVLIVDEADGMTGTPEGAPLDLAVKRTVSFPDRKIVVGSTPVLEGASPVLDLWGESDQRVFEVPCPECGAFTEIEWAQIVWEPNQPETARWRCPSCETDIEERHKTGMVEAGQWRVTRPEIGGHAGFRVNALVSPHANATWPKLVKEWLAAQSDPARLQPFVNTVLGQGWRGVGDLLDEAELAARAEDFGLDAIPAEVKAITAGADVQRDRIECTFVGWTEGGVALVLGHTIAWGRWDDDTTWVELDAALSTIWDRADGKTIGVAAACIDAGDGVTMEKVISYALSRRRRRVVPIKGEGDGSRPWVDLPVKAGRRRKTNLHLVGVTPIKRHLFDRMTRPGWVRFSRDLEPVFYEQLTGERRVVRYYKGRAQELFEPVPGRRNEALDCLVYATAASKIIPAVPWYEIGDHIGPAGQKPKRPGWFGGERRRSR